MMSMSSNIMYKKIPTNDKFIGFNDNKKFRKLRKFRFFGRAKVYLLVKWPHLVGMGFVVFLLLALKNHYFPEEKGSF